MQTYNLCIISEDSQESRSSQEDPYGVILISESLCTSKEISGLCLVKGTAGVCFLGSLRLTRIQLENCKEYFPCIQTLSFRWTDFLFVNQDICKCFISFGPDSFITNALLCGADDVSAQTAHWDSINYIGRKRDYLNGDTEIPFGGTFLWERKALPCCKNSIRFLIYFFSTNMTLNHSFIFFLSFIYWIFIEQQAGMLDMDNKVINKRGIAPALMELTCGGVSKKITRNKNIILP